MPAAKVHANSQFKQVGAREAGGREGVEMGVGCGGSGEEGIPFETSHIP